jgi:hypothetical protein
MYKMHTPNHPSRSFVTLGLRLILVLTVIKGKEKVGD